EKLGLLFGLLQREGAERTLIFVNMRRTADQLCRTLAANGIEAEQITGDIDQRKRLKILEEFREGRLPILIATDVASRGLHIDGVTPVINYDLPLDPEDYVHRVGRTARAGASGKAISLACEDYVEGLEAIEKLIGFKLPYDFPDDDMLVPYKEPPRQPRRRSEDGGRGERRGRERGGRRDERREPRPAAVESEAAAPAAEGTEAAPAAAGEGAAAPRKRRRRRRRAKGQAAAGTTEATGATATAETGAATAATGDGESAAASGETSAAATGGEGAAKPGRRRRRRRRGRRGGA